MRSPIGFGIAVAATASLALAGNGPGEGGKGGEPTPGRFFQDAKVTFTPGHGITFDGGDEFSLNWTNAVQASWTYFNQDNGLADGNTFAADRVRLDFSGHVWSRDITYRVQSELTNRSAIPGTDTSSVLDAWVDWHINDYVGVKLGLQKFYGGLEGMGDYWGLEFGERSVASRAFSNARSVGADFHGNIFQGEEEEHALKWHASVFNTDNALGSTAATSESLNQTAPSNEVNFSFGLAYDFGGEYVNLQGDLEHSGDINGTFGANIYVGNEDTTGVGTGADVETTNINIFGAAKFGNGFAAQGEVWIREDDVDNGPSADSNGYYVQGSYTLPPGSNTQWGFGGRFSVVDLEDSPILQFANGISNQTAFLSNATGATGGGTVTEISGMVSAYYHKQRLKTQVVYTFQEDDPNGAASANDNHFFQVYFTALF